MDVAAWLRGLGAAVRAGFRENDIDAAVLPELTAEDLVGLGVGSIGHRRRDAGCHRRSGRRVGGEYRIMPPDEIAPASSMPRIPAVPEASGGR